ncbi:hypothetical protein HB772_18515 [Sinorhizobium meliloti]|nr:hypothetical protein HB772_18515 [Sinorhizobium meliloti]
MTASVAELIQRLEAATGPNYALEIDIFKFANPKYDEYVEGRGGLVHPSDGEDQRVLSNVRPSNYTASIDTALRLLEWLLPDWSGVVDFGKESPLRRADIYGPVKEMGEDEYGAPVEVRDFSWGEAPTPALALCIAIFKAVQEQQA